MNEVLQTRQVIPPITARTAEGLIVRSGDYKQKRNLVIAFLHADCRRCAEWLSQLTARAAILTEHQASALIISCEIPPPSALPLPASFIAATDAAGRSQRAFLGRTAFGPTGLDRVGTFVTDRYGELYAQWTGRDAPELPGPEEIVGTLWQIQNAC
jgi:hypothetical protein